MKRYLGMIATAGPLLIGLFAMQPALAQKSGGVLKISFFDNPASMSLHEEATGAALRPMMGVFNNLVMYDQHVAQNSPDSIIPDLATSWVWSEDGKELTFPLRQGVKWHDGKPFTAADVKCTWDLLLGIGSEKLRVNPRKTWYLNLDRVTTNGDYEVTFHLKRPQPALLSLLASGWSPVYPCHVPPRDMRTHPIGTGPFKFVEFKPNEVVRDDEKPGLLEAGPALSRRHRVAHHQGCRDAKPDVHRRQFRHLFALRHDGSVAGRCQEPGAAGGLRADIHECEPQPDPQPGEAAVRQPGSAPGSGADPRSQGLYRHHHQGKGDIGGTMLPPPEGLWGMPPEMLATLPGYDPDIAKNRAEARKIMEKLGYGPDKRLAAYLVLAQHPRLPRSGGDPD